MSTCPYCDSARVSEVEIFEHFPYGIEEPRAMLVALVPKLTCADCMQSWTDQRGADARMLAVLDYEGVTK